MTRLTDYLDQTLYVAIVDFGGKIGCGNTTSGLTPDSSAVQQEYDDFRSNTGNDGKVWAIEGGTQVDVTDIFERRYQDWLDARPRKDEWGREIMEREDRP